MAIKFTFQDYSLLLTNKIQVFYLFKLVYVTLARISIFTSQFYIVLLNIRSIFRLKSLNKKKSISISNDIWNSFYYTFIFYSI